MLKEFVEKILSLSAVEILEISGSPYSTHALHPVMKTPEPVTKLCMNTLAGMIDYLEANIDDILLSSTMIVVNNYDSVSLCSDFMGDHNRRQHYMQCESDGIMTNSFRFGQQYAIKDFIINLQSSFVENDDSAKLLDLVSNIKVSEKEEYVDTGHTQKVTTAKGATLVDSITVPNPVHLKPYRTFLEVEQPESPFVFRLHSNGTGQPPACSLHEASGGLWKLNAIASIKAWLVAQCDKKKIDITIIA